QGHLDRPAQLGDGGAFGGVLQARDVLRPPVRGRIATRPWPAPDAPSPAARRGHDRHAPMADAGRHIAVTRGVSPAIARCELAFLERAPIDYPRAVAQHAAYERLLEDLGLKGLR